MRWYQRFFRRELTEKRLDAELRFHLEQRIADLVTGGMTQEEARRRARLEFGGLDQVKEECRDVGASHIIETVVQDIRYGLRQLRRNPGFTAVAILTLALGIGANTAIFSLIDTVMLRMLPVQKPEELVQLQRYDPRRGGEPSAMFTSPLWEQVRDRQDVFSGVFAWGADQFDLAHGGAVQAGSGIFVSGGYFSTLGVRPAAGRLFTSSDDQRGCAAVAVLSYKFWQDHFGGMQSVIGKTLSLDHHPFQIIGASAPGFYGAEVGKKFDVAVPLCAAADLGGKPLTLDQRSWWWLRVIGRVKVGIGSEKLKARLALLWPQIAASALPQDWDAKAQANFLKQVLLPAPAAWGVSGLRRQFAKPLGILMAVVGLVLLIACANIASLMLARSASRRKEIVVRQALGASRARLIRQLLTECVLLSTAGALLGILFARWGAALLVRYISTAGYQVFLDLCLDSRVLGFTAVIAALTGIIFGVLPAFRSTRASLASAMKGGEAAETGRHLRFRAGKWTVASQLALSLVLVNGAGLFLRSFENLTSLDIGFDRNDVLLVSANLKAANVRPEQRLQAYQQIEDRLRALPGVISASRSWNTPISGQGWHGYLHPDSPNPPAGETSLTWFNSISPGYFETLRTPLLAGRDFNDQDTKAAPQVAIVNETLSRRFYPTINPLGSVFRIDSVSGNPGPPIQIVGVTKDSKYESLREETYATAFFPITQQVPGGDNGEIFELRTATPPSSLASAVQRAVADVNKSISLEFHTLSEQVDDSLVQQRTLASLSGFFGGLALLLAMLGLYGALSYLVNRRQTEFGVRMALGAQPGSIFWSVMRQVASILLVGIVAGLGIWQAATWVLKSMLFGLGPRDTWTMLSAVGVLTVVALLASYVPARRAAKVDPMVALRYE